MSSSFLQSLKRATPTILSVIAGTGLIGTTVLAVKAATKADKEINDEVKRLKLASPDRLVKNKNGEYSLSYKDAFKLTWRIYFPTIMTGGATLACIISANMMSGKQIASLSSAYALIREQYDRYVAKTKEICGEDIHESIIKSLAIEQARDVYLHCEGGFADNTLSIGDRNPEEKILFYDSFGNRYFEKALSDVIEAEYHLNRNYSLGGCVSLKDFYDFLGLTPLSGSDKLGWIGEMGLNWIDFDHNVATLDDGLECVIITMAFTPENMEDYY